MAGTDAPLAVPASSQPLLSYLLISGKSADRDQLAETLWPDREPRRSRRCLSTALWRLNQAAGDWGELIAAESRQRLSFNWKLPHWFDVSAFRRRAAAAGGRAPAALDARTLHRLEQAAALYRDDLLCGIDEDWAVLERERLREQSLGVLNALARGFYARGELERALPHARALARREPLREDAHRLVMRLYAEMGARAKAVEQFRICEGELGSELGVPPMEETRALFETISGRSTAPDAARLQARMRAARLEATLDTTRSRVTAVRRLLARSDAQLAESLALLDRAAALEPPESR
ncbi:MAG: BTAD domain-containing putative transcriptional regulator [Oceanicaulis sp.]